MSRTCPDTRMTSSKLRVTSKSHSIIKNQSSVSFVRISSENQNVRVQWRIEDEGSLSHVARLSDLSLLQYHRVSEGGGGKCPKDLKEWNLDLDEWSNSTRQHVNLIIYMILSRIRWTDTYTLEKKRPMSIPVNETSSIDCEKHTLWIIASPDANLIIYVLLKWINCTTRHSTQLNKHTYQEQLLWKKHVLTKNDHMHFRRKTE